MADARARRRLYRRVNLDEVFTQSRAERTQHGETIYTDLRKLWCKLYEVGVTELTQGGLVDATRPEAITRRFSDIRVADRLTDSVGRVFTITAIDKVDRQFITLELGGQG